MKFSEPYELQDKELTLLNLKKLDFIELEEIKNRENEVIIKIKLLEKFSGLKSFLGLDWIGQILQDKYTKKYYFCNEQGKLDDIIKIDDFDKIKLFIGCLK